MPNETGERVFTSWKDIAAFFGKGVRTVQRWEQKFGLPISRPTAAKNVVLATERELREWIRSSSSQLAKDGVLPENGEELSEISNRLKRLEEDTARLAQLVAEFSDRIDELSSGRNSVPTATPILKNSAPKTELPG